ncbi:ClpP/crotonase-like domain-containing protein [Mycena pura]|uniref:ClpP/crotonase-like domain-containing protein n=1 Tax=Mycena pura TaxID=153505 RepID=A0AAD6YSV1_9AGAR|nr:ClpP/crotonase-like domain-containing protein [Mycena pura]
MFKLKRMQWLGLSARAYSRQAFLEPLSTRPGITCLSLNRPEAKNAISTTLLNELRESLESVHSDGSSVRALILRSSTPGSFCAGADLAERRTMSDAQVGDFLTSLRRVLGLLESLPMPTICAIDGPALGGGLEMGLACDLRVAAFGVEKIGLPETGLGIIPGAGGTQRAARLLGQSKAKDLIFTGRLLTAKEAHECGLVDYISDPGSSAFDKALWLAEMMARNAPLAVRAAKHVISRSEDLPLETGLDFERAAYNLLIPSRDRVEALEAFKQKRRPVFKGE